MNATKFKRLVNKNFRPEIHKIGWTGKDFDYLKLEENHLIKVFGMYGSWTGGCIYCETGVHYDFLPIYCGNNKLIDKITVTECLIRPRLSVGTWNFYEEKERNIQQVQGILNEFLTSGKSFYTDFENFPEPFENIKADEVYENNYRLMGKYHIDNPTSFMRMLKDINLYLGRLDLAKEFSERGIKATEEFAKKVLVGRKSKSYRMMEESIKVQIDNLKIK